jgi:hypothetical protein
MYVHDLRMIGDDAEAGCVARFIPSGVRPSGGHVTAVKFSTTNASELLGSWSGQHAYLFDMFQEPLKRKSSHVKAGDNKGKAREDHGNKRTRRGTVDHHVEMVVGIPNRHDTQVSIQLPVRATSPMPLDRTFGALKREARQAHDQAVSLFHEHQYAEAVVQFSHEIRLHNTWIQHSDDHDLLMSPDQRQVLAYERARAFTYRAIARLYDEQQASSIRLAMVDSGRALTIDDEDWHILWVRAVTCWIAAQRSQHEQEVEQVEYWDLLDEASAQAHRVADKLDPLAHPQEVEDVATFIAMVDANENGHGETSADLDDLVELWRSTLHIPQNSDEEEEEDADSVHSSSMAEIANDPLLMFDTVSNEDEDDMWDEDDEEEEDDEDDVEDLGASAHYASHVDAWHETRTFRGHCNVQACPVIMDQRV